MLKPKKHFHTPLQKRNPSETFPLEVEHLLDIFAQIEARRQIRRRVAEKESLNAPSKKSS